MNFDFLSIFAVRNCGGISCENIGVRNIPHLIKLLEKMDNLINAAKEAMWVKKEMPSFKAGDTITVSYKIIEGNKERVQSFRGVVIQIKGEGLTKMFTIRKISNGVGVERIFPLYSPHIDSIEVNKVGVDSPAGIYLCVI